MATQARKSATKKTTGKAAKKTIAKAAKKTAAKAPARKVAKAAKPATKKAATKKTASKATAKKTVARKPLAKKAASKSTTKRAAAPVKRAAKVPVKAATTQAGRSTAKKTPRPARKPRGITPEQALANTRALLEAKQAHDREPPPWQSLETPGGHASPPGFQTDEARIKADELHAGESRMQAIQGSISTQDRHQQGKRDAR
jgi:hypothetical protein